MNDIADARSIAVVRTRLPYIDRRALSQAWFSALHVADVSPSGRPGRASKTAMMGAARAARAATSASRRLAPYSQASGGPLGRTGTRLGDASAETFVQRSQRARVQRPVAAVTRASVDDPRSYPPFQTSLTVGVEGARVALLLRREGATLHVVALCAPANVELVRRALACADAHLRLRGDRIRASVRSAAEVRA